MVATSRAKARGGASGGGRRRSNSEGRRDSGRLRTARDNPLTAAAVVGGAVAAGLFLWSRRNQLSEQMGNLTDKIADWRETMGAAGHLEDGSDLDRSLASSSESGGSGRTQAEIAEEALTLKQLGETA